MVCVCWDFLAGFSCNGKSTKPFSYLPHFFQQFEFWCIFHRLRAQAFPNNRDCSNEGYEIETPCGVCKFEPDDIFQWYTGSNPIFFDGMQVLTWSYFSVVEVYFRKLKDQPFPVSGSSYVENVFLINRDWPNSLDWTYRRDNCNVS